MVLRAWLGSLAAARLAPLPVGSSPIPASTTTKLRPVSGAMGQGKQDQSNETLKSARKLADVMKMGGSLAFSPYGFHVRASSALTMFYAVASMLASLYLQVVLAK